VFTGFPPEALAFYEGLDADNSKAYWHAHRETYEDCVREPLELLVAELAPEFGAAKVFRPYRDVRFSKDKRPYKSHAAAIARHDGHTSAARYVEVSAKGLRLGGGMWEPDRTRLERIRRAIDDDASGGELERIRAKLETHGLTLTAPELKTAPRGYPKDHPRIDLLRRKRYGALVQPGTGPWLHDRRALDRVRSTWRELAPLLDWLERHTA
jgi:uncharacterized protein (TIGR02453 family)